MLERNRQNSQRREFQSFGTINKKTLSRVVVNFNYGYLKQGL